VSINPGYVAFKLAFQLSPIILTNGIASSIRPGQMLPIIAITESINFVTGLLSQADDISLDDFFASYEPLPGSTLIENEIGKYPFANQAIAANAIIAQPLIISLLMHCPVRKPLGYAAKLATMIALQTALTNHNSAGGTYTIATPSFFYTDCIMRRMVDASTGDSKQAQNTWRLDFEKPLITLSQALAAQQVQNARMSSLSSGETVQASNGAISWTGLAATASPSSLATLSVVPAATGSPAAGVAGVVGP
jgi:hypothetical protein